MVLPQFVTVGRLQRQDEVVLTQSTSGRYHVDGGPHIGHISNRSAAIIPGPPESRTSTRRRYSAATMSFDRAEQQRCGTYWSVSVELRQRTLYQCHLDASCTELQHHLQAGEGVRTRWMSTCEGIHTPDLRVNGNPYSGLRYER